MDLSTLSRLKAHATKISSTDQDAILQQLLTGVSAQVERHVFSDIGYAEKKAYTEQFDVESGQRLIYLNHWPVDSAATFTVKNAWDRDFASVSALDSDVYYVKHRRGTVRFDRWDLLPGAGVLQVVYTGGLGTDASDVVAKHPDAALAVELQVMHLFRRRETLDLSNISGEGGSVALVVDRTPLLPEVRELLRPLKRVL